MRPRGGGGNFGGSDSVLGPTVDFDEFVETGKCSTQDVWDEYVPKDFD